MIQEYLFTSDEHRHTVEQYAPESCEKDIYDIDNSDCWIVTYSKEGTNESSAKILSSVHSYIVNNFHPTVLSNECSAYYNKALYPHFNEFERKLRKLLYLKSALSRDAKGSALIKDLESKDFGEIFTLLFSDAQFVQGTKALVNNKTWQFTKDEILAAIEAISENTVWDNLIGKDAVPLLRSDFAKVKSFRNDIMHAHSMETAKYNEAAKLIKEINKQLDAEIGNIIGTKETVQGDSAQDFNAALGDAIRNMDEAQSIKNWQEQLIALQSSIPTIKSENLTAALTAYTKIIDSPGFKAAQQLVSSPQWDSIQRSLKGISKIQTDISPALIELQKVASSIHQAVPPELLALQQSLQAFKPDPALLELLQKLNRWQDRLSDGQDKT
ncbi:MAG: hypothetical protein PUE18_01095 [Firmicutes bacterium]|jgi:hypothetical protein|nr:hypothetical protein [Bacillota bacterium]